MSAVKIVSIFLATLMCACATTPLTPAPDSATKPLAEKPRAIQPVEPTHFYNPYDNDTISREMEEARARSEAISSQVFPCR